MSPNKCEASFFSGCSQVLHCLQPFCQLLWSFCPILIVLALYTHVLVCVSFCVCVCPFVVVPTSMSAVSPNDSLVPAFASDGTLHASTLFMVFYGILWHFIASSKDAHPLTHTHTHTHTHTDADNRQFSKAYTKSNRIESQSKSKSKSMSILKRRAWDLCINVCVCVCDVSVCVCKLPVNIYCVFVAHWTLINAPFVQLRVKCVSFLPSFLSTRLAETVIIV